MDATPGRNDAAFANYPASATGVSALVAGVIVLTLDRALPAIGVSPGTAPPRCRAVCATTTCGPGV